MDRLLRPKPVRSVLDFASGAPELVLGAEAVTYLDQLKLAREMEGATDQRSWTRPWTVGRPERIDPLNLCGPTKDKPYTPGGTGFVVTGALIWNDFCGAEDSALERFEALRAIPAEWYEPEFLALLEAEIAALDTNCVTPLDTSKPIDLPIFTGDCVDQTARLCNDWRSSPYLSSTFAADIIKVVYAERLVKAPYLETEPRDNVWRWLIKAEFAIVFQDPRRILP